MKKLVPDREIPEREKQPTPQECGYPTSSPCGVVLIEMEILYIKNPIKEGKEDGD